MTESNKSIPIIFDLDNSALDSDRELLVRAYLKSKKTGRFPVVNPKNREEVINVVKKELRFLPFEVLPTGEIGHAQTINACRGNSFYIFKIDQKNSFNKAIRAELPNWPIYHLNFLDRQSYCFYFVDNPKDLAILGSVFSKWASKLDYPID